MQTNASRGHREWQWRVVLLGCTLLVAATAPGAQQSLPTAEEAFGFPVGADRQLASWDQVTGYLDDLADASDRVRVIDIGQTTMGKRFVGVVVSSPENLAALDRYQDIVRRLADPRRTDADTAATLAQDGKVIVAIGASIHASEVGAAQMAPELVHHLASDDSTRTQRILDNVIFLLFPSLNPDGMDLVVDWYRSTLDQPWEGGGMPWLYNQYVGHDINRDFFMLNQQENRLLAQVFYEDWLPQVFLSMHQMGSRGPRMFVPPNYEPIDPNYEPLIWRQAGLLGHAMATELEAHGLSGVITNAMYDYFFPGYEDSGPLGHNTVCLLTEVASVRLATPLTVARDELQGTSKGLPDYGIQQNFPNPWQGGSWRLRDIVDYDFRAAVALLDAAAKFREELLHNFYRMGRNQVRKGQTEPPYAFVVPAEQRDPLTAAKMIDILRLGRVEVTRARTPFEADGRRYAAGSYVVSMAQPYRAYAKTLLESQTYPARRLYPGGPVERPYDVSGWTLPLQMGVTTIPVQRAFEMDGESIAKATRERVRVNLGGAEVLALPAAINDAFVATNRILASGGTVYRTTAETAVADATMPAGTFIVTLERGRREVVETVEALGVRATPLPRRPDAGLLAELRTPRVALYKPWTASMDEGWTRWLFEEYEIPFVTLTDAEVRAGDLATRLDVIVLPSIRGATASIVEGNEPGSTAPEYVGGIGTDGVTHLREFVERGGTLVALGASTAFAIDRLDLPVRNVLADLPREEFFCPGSILRTRVDPEHPVAYGMPDRSIAVFQSSPAFEVEAQLGSRQPRIVASYAESLILLSGWIEGEQHLAGKAAIVDVPVGDGRVVLFGFGVQQRAQPHATFKMLFNALHYGVLDTTGSGREETERVTAPVR